MTAAATAMAEALATAMGGGTDNNQIKLQKWRRLQLGAAAMAMVAASATAMGWAQTTINLSYRNGGGCS